MRRPSDAPPIPGIWTIIGDVPSATAMPRMPGTRLGSQTRRHSPNQDETLLSISHNYRRLEYFQIYKPMFFPYTPWRMAHLSMVSDTDRYVH